ncbi:alkaline phosphatase-like [Diadema antillarum]|uniref:alkaline phosphatase-like n=1 Tax=Diadema antillarum TaxID=105358 RepID=UPI003A89783F
MFCFVLLTVAYLSVVATAQDAAYWNRVGQDTLDRVLAVDQNQGVAKNVVLFIGDGMNTATITASRIYRGQLAGRSGEDDVLSWETFPNVGLMKTYNTNHQVPDSASTATAIVTGVKSKFGTVGVDDRVQRGQCSSISEGVEGGQLDSLLVLAHMEGKATGFVSTARVSHATPASLYAHSVDRNWEGDYEVPADQLALGCTDIASQLVYNNSFINVILGGGRRVFLPTSEPDPEYGPDGVTGRRTDGKDLTEVWQSGKESAIYVWNKTAFNDVDPSSTDFLLGLFEPSHMRYDNDRPNDRAGEPSLAEMTTKAIEILQKDENGFFLLVEAARIDHAHHDTVAKDALSDTVALDAAVAAAIDLTSTEDTLIIVTADHGHTFSFGGYPTRGNPILGFDDYWNGTDGLPYLTLSYANGPGAEKVVESYNRTGKRPNHLDTDTYADGFMQDAIAPLSEETHGGQDVSVHASGPWSHLFCGVREQNYIAHAVRFAACYGDRVDNACTRDSNDANTSSPLSIKLICLAVITAIAGHVINR